LFQYHRWKANLRVLEIEEIKSANKKVIDINEYRWKKHCRGLFELPMAAELGFHHGQGWCKRKCGDAGVAR
jgi:hypothetical protein